MKRLLCCMMLLLLAASVPAQGEGQGAQAVFIHEFIPFSTPEGTDSDHGYRLCADGEGGFYALTRDSLLRWRKGARSVDILCDNRALDLWGLAVHQEQLYGVSLRTGLYRFVQGHWQGLGMPPFLTDAAVGQRGGPAHLTAGLIATASQLYFICTDREQETTFLCSYAFADRAFSYEPDQVFASQWGCYDEARNLLIGSVQDPVTKACYLGMYNAQRRTLISCSDHPFTREVAGLNSATGQVMAADYAGVLIGVDDASMQLIQGSPGKLGLLAWLDDQHFACIQGRRKDQNGRICVYRYAPDDLAPHE